LIIFSVPATSVYKLVLSDDVSLANAPGESESPEKPLMCLTESIPGLLLVDIDSFKGLGVADAND
jgi:hypothetical protein